MDAVADVHLVVPTAGERLDLIRACVSSVLAQTHPVRVSVIALRRADEVRRAVGSSDRLIVSEQRGRGLSAGINQGWADDGWQSEFCGWLGDDDALPPTSVQEAVRVLRARPAASMVHGRCLVMDGDGRPRTVIRNGAVASRLVGYGMNLLAQPGALFRTRTVRDCGALDESLSYAMDVDLYLRLKAHGPIASTPKQLGVFRAHDAGLSTAASRPAFREARAASRSARHHRGAALADAVALPLTAVVGRISRALPPSLESYWRPQ